MDFGGISVLLILSVIIAIATCMPAAFLFWLVKRLIEQPTSDVWATLDKGAKIQRPKIMNPQLSTMVRKLSSARLTGTEKQLYDIIKITVLNMSVECQAKTCFRKKQVERILEYIEYSPELFWVQKSKWTRWECPAKIPTHKLQPGQIKGILTTEQTYSFSRDKVMDISYQLDKAISRFSTSVNKVNIDVCVGQIIRMLSVDGKHNNSMCVSRDSDSSFLDATAVGPILYGEGNNMGYCKAFALLMLATGHDIAICTGEYQGNPHIWNLYLNEDGERCIVDICYDMKSSSLTVIQKESEEGAEKWVSTREFWFCSQIPHKRKCAA